MVVKVDPGIFTKGGSFNANQFIEPRDDELKAQYENDYLGTNVFQGAYKEKQSQLSFDILKQLATKVAPISAIINTRITQVGAFTSQSRFNDNALGFKIKPINPEKDVTEDMEKEILELEKFILNCGFSDSKSRDSFDTFIRKIVRDSLTLDQVNFEIIRDDDDKPFEFYAVDASTIRAATDDYTPDDELVPEDGEELSDEDEAKYVQVIEGKVTAWFTEDELAFSVRNPRTDVNIQPYGLSEIELIMKQLSSYLEAEDYNMRFFQQGGMTKGILNIKEDPNGISGQRGLESFKRQWRTQVTGQQGAWKIPIFQLPGNLEFINIGTQNGDIVFEKWINYLINISCAVYQIDPAEINFPNNGGVGGKGSSLFDGQNDKVESSKDKGLYPLLQFLENMINHYLISDFSDEYVFTFIGMDKESEESRLRNDQIEVSNFKTVNEKRQERGLEPLDHGDIILSPYYTQAMSMGGQGGGDNGEMFSIYGDDEDGDLETEDENDIDEDLNADFTVGNIPMEKSFLFKEIK